MEKNDAYASFIDTHSDMSVRKAVHFATSFIVAPTLESELRMFSIV